MGMPGPKKINRYGLDFKLRAVRMSEQPGLLIKDVAESLCIHPFMLSKWRKQSETVSSPATPRSPMQPLSRSYSGCAMSRPSTVSCRWSMTC